MEGQNSETEINSEPNEFLGERVQVYYRLENCNDS